MKKNIKIILIFTFFLFNILSFSNTTKFLSVGNVKIVRPEPLNIKREDLNITIEKNGEIKVESFYTFQNIGDKNIKSTFMFWLDQNINNNPENKLTNVKGKYIKNVKFFSDYKKSKSLRAVINFDEKIYDNQEKENIQREWFAISKIIKSEEIANLGVYYTLINTNIQKEKKFTYSFELVDNFNEKNKTEILYVNIYNKSNKKIKNIEYKGYEFVNLNKKEKEHYELLVGNVNLDGKMVINFE